MAIQVRVDMSRFKVDEQLDGVVKATKTNTEKYADTIRDVMKEEFYKTTHKGDYGAATPVRQGSSASLAEHGLVKSMYSDGNYTVGAKRGNTYGTDYATIFARLIEGRNYSKPHTFGLPKHRQSASDDGYWKVKTIEPHPFIDNTMKVMNGSKGDKIFKQVFQKDIERILGG